MNTTLTAVLGALAVALAGGMSEDNAEDFVQAFVLHLAAKRLGMHAAADRAIKICNMLQRRPAADVERALLPTQKVSAGLAAEAENRLLRETAAILEEIEEIA